MAIGLDDVAGFSVASAAELAGAKYNSRLALSRQHDAQDFSASQFAHRYQTEVEDLKNAGLNPMLAYMHGPGSSPTSSAASAQGVAPSEVYNQHRIASSVEALNVANVSKTKAETDNVKADTLSKLNLPAYWMAKTLEASNSAEQSQALAAKIRNVEIPKLQQEIINLKSQVSKNKSDIQLNNSLIDANAMLTALRSTEAVLNGFRTSHLQQEMDIMKPKARAAQDWSAEAGYKAEQRSKMWQEDWRIVNPFSH